MNHLICRIENFEIVALYTLRIVFDDHSQQIVDFQPVLRGELYGPLRDLALFNQVAPGSEVHTLVWPNGGDSDPATLHEWSRCASAFGQMARTWNHAST
jgi:hypothetical protein